MYCIAMWRVSPMHLRRIFIFKPLKSIKVSANTGIRPMSHRTFSRAGLFDHRSGHLLVGNGHSGGTSVENVNRSPSAILDDQFGSGRKWWYAHSDRRCDQRSHPHIGQSVTTSKTTRRWNDTVAMRFRILFWNVWNRSQRSGRRQGNYSFIELFLKFHRWNYYPFMH